MEIYGGLFVVSATALVALTAIWLHRTINFQRYSKGVTDLIAVLCVFFFVAVSVSVFDPWVKSLGLSKGWSTGLLLAITFSLLFIAGAFIEKIYLPKKRKQLSNKLKITPPGDPLL